ncbi:MAG: 16S rRNA pseudouridine(516) synthase [Burkholderiaceae bacterium]|nr:16S rRNA pseudouridine(516) synthase [Burkholderiaceae bacterium]
MARKNTKAGAPATLALADALFSQGLGARRECEGLVATGLVRVNGRTVTDPFEPVATEGLVLEVEGKLWPYHAQAVILMHKPAGYECSQKPSAWPSVLTLLPGPLRRRDVQPVGRLDVDTTGLLLLTDDGALIHRLTHPKRHVPKVYEVTTARPVEEGQLEKLRAGVKLHDEPALVRVLACERSGECSMRMTLGEGKYHQVKRMVAAVGNHVEALHRSAFGALTLPADLAPGQWRWIDDPAVITAAAARPD